MSNFKREDRYLVLKLSDLKKYLSVPCRQKLSAIAEEIECYRFAHGKEPLQAVVVERDWPEYESVWKMIEERATNQAVKVTSLSDELKEQYALRYQYLREQELDTDKGGVFAGKIPDNIVLNGFELDEAIDAMRSKGEKC